MRNKELAKILYEISSHLKMEEVSFKPYVYQRAAQSIGALEEDIGKIYEKGGIKALEEIPGVGKNIALKIEEYLTTGAVKYYEQLKKQLPIDLSEINSIEGMGPRKAKVLYNKLGIKNLKGLEKAARAGKIRGLSGFGEKTEKNILQGIEFLKKSRGRFLLGDIIGKVEQVVEKIKNLPFVQEANVGGSVRRMKETVGDVDILAASENSAKVVDFFVTLPGVVKVWAKGPTRSSIRIEEGFDIDLRVVRMESYGSALQYFTGSKEHNISIRRLAMEKGLKLNEYGVFKGTKRLAGRTEKEVYETIGLAWIPPELRENQGEVEAALREFEGGKDGLPKIIDYQDIKGDLHLQTDWDGGSNSIEDMAKEAKKMGYEYLGISDHTKFLRIENGLDEKKLLAQKRYIEKLRKKITGIAILQGCEANILAQGSIDIKDEVLAQLDYVIAGVHSQMKMTKTEMTERIIKAMRNPHVDIISHPTGRILQRRDEYQIDLAKIIKAAKETGTVLEINSYPERLDLKDLHIRQAKEAGVKMIINTDAHRKEHMRYINFGIAQSRRGWAEKKDIINCQPLSKLLTFF